MNRAKIGIVTGLQAEAQWLRKAGFMVRPGGGTPHGAMKAAETLVEAGACALISFGLAGGLKPGLKPGAVLVPSVVISGTRTYPCDYRLMEFLGGATQGPIVGGQKIAASVQAKTLLYQRNHPVAIDLESGSVAEIAKDKNLPFAVLRAVADPAERNLPPAALVALKEDGSLDIIRLMHSIVRQPWQIPGLIAVGRDAKAARKALLERLKTLPASP
jgi:adenosylhomocysteine nucleosidase